MTQETAHEWIDINRPTLPPVEQREWRHVLWQVSDAGVLALTLNRPERLTRSTTACCARAISSLSTPATRQRSVL
jgi:hypothetical protein